MSTSVLYMSMSLDGYIAGPNDAPDNPGGDGFLRLHEWGLTADGAGHRTAGAAGQLNDEIHATGAVLTGRRTAEQADHWGGDHHGRGVPIFVLSHSPRPPSVAHHPLVTYLADGIESAMARAKAAAGDRDVLVHGADTAQQAVIAAINVLHKCRERVHSTSRRCHRSGTPGRHSSAFCDGRADCAERYARATVDDVAASCGRDGNQTV